MIHVAILLKPYLDAVLDGRKRIESRFTVTSRVPYRAIRTGERIYFKQSSGPFRATAKAAHVLFLDELTPKRMKELRRIYNDAILGHDEYWDWKSDSHYASLIWLQDVEPITFGPKIAPQRGIAWLKLESGLDVYPKCVDREVGSSQPDFEDGSGHDDEPCIIRVTLTGGNIRQSHVNVRRVRSMFPKWAIGGASREEAAKRLLTLDLAGGPRIETDIVEGKNIFRSRGAWREWFEEHDAHEDDELLFFPIGAGRYEVRLQRSRRRRKGPNREARA